MQLSASNSVADSILVADIGGTNARFAFTQAGQECPPLLAQHRVATTDFATLKDALLDYLGRHPQQRPARAVLAVASAVTGDAIKITNNPWAFSISQLGREIGMPVEVINDFTAMASVLPVLKVDDLQAVGTAQPSNRAQATSRCYAVVGPGTGLGVGGVIVQGGRAVVIQSEGGHVGFAPGNAYELELLKALLTRYPRVSAERLISGSGLGNLLQAVAAVEGQATLELTPAQITETATADPHGLCARTLRVFAELLGSFAGDVALALGAWDGVFLPGGVTQKLLPWIMDGGFRQRFEDKGRHSAILQRIPTQIITHPQAGLLGTAVHATA